MGEKLNKMSENKHDFHLKSLAEEGRAPFVCEALSTNFETRHLQEIKMD